MCFLGQEVCIMDIYQPSSYGRRRRDLQQLPPPSGGIGLRTLNETPTVAEYSSPLLRHWKTVVGPTESDDEEELIDAAGRKVSSPASSSTVPTTRKPTKRGLLKRIKPETLERGDGGKDQTQNGTNTNFGDNIGFSVIMPPGESFLVLTTPVPI